MVLYMKVKLLKFPNQTKRDIEFNRIIAAFQVLEDNDNYEVDDLMLQLLIEYFDVYDSHHHEHIIEHLKQAKYWLLQYYSQE